MRITNMPDNLKDAIQILLCERTYLIQLVKGLIDKILPKDRPKFYDDPFLEKEYQKLEKEKIQISEAQKKEKVFKQVKRDVRE